MIKIGRIYTAICGDQARLCADIDVDGRCHTLWYGVLKEHVDFLTQDRADSFVLLFTTLAMTFGHDIISESPISARLHYQIKYCLVPTLHNVDEKFKIFNIIAPLTATPHKNIGGVATAFSGGVDSMYTVMRHLSSSEIPLTHLMLFNVGEFEGKDNHEKFRLACTSVDEFAEEINLPTIFLDSNQYDIMPDIGTRGYGAFFKMAGALALQGLLSSFLYSSATEVSQIVLSKYLLSGATCEPITFFNFSTEGVTVYLSGMEVTRYEKLEQLSNWKQSYHWLHPCFHKVLPSRENCGFCKKCARDIVALYTMGKLDRYASIFPLEHFIEKLPELIATVMIHSEYDACSEEALQLFLQKGHKIPRETYTILKRSAMVRRSLTTHANAWQQS